MWRILKTFVATRLTSNTGYNIAFKKGFSDGRIDAHLITPSDTSEERAAKHHLHPVQCWVNLTHADTYIHSPFDFATVRGRKTWDHVNQECWDALTAKSLMFSNPLPSFTVPTYSIHVDHGIHAIFPGMVAAAVDDDRSPQMEPWLSPGKNALAPPPYCFFFENPG
jgi:hypothetical protein